MNIRIFKAISGEIVIGGLVAADHHSTFDQGADLADVKLIDTKSFDISIPCTIVYTQQGPRLAPFLGWVGPDAEAVVRFAGAAVLFEVLDTDEGGKHEKFLQEYRVFVSPIALAKAPTIQLVQ